VAGGLWVPDLISRALRDAGLAAEVWPALRRIEAVPKSAWAAPGERPSVTRHVESMRLDNFIPPTGHIVLVDDFVTKGRTLLAAAKVLDKGVPGIDVRGFAYVRTMGLTPDIERLGDPVVGTIRSADDDAFREP
jgi:predicted amidophosphoribosyltransferase